MGARPKNTQVLEKEDMSINPEEMEDKKSKKSNKILKMKNPKIKLIPNPKSLDLLKPFPATIPRKTFQI